MMTTVAISSKTGETSVETTDSYTIVRVKRKRNEEPLDALVFESHARKRTKDVKPSEPGQANSGASVTVFPFAGTIEASAWKDDATQKQLQASITVLAKRPPEIGDRPGGEHVPESDQLAAPELLKSERPMKKLRRYTIVDNKTGVPSNPAKAKDNRYPTEPPKVLAASSLPAKTNFNLYDAVLSTPTRQGSSASVAPPSPVDAEMERFLPLLQEYLKISDIELAAPAAEAKPRPPVRQDSGPEGDVGTSTRIGSRDEDDYVWDVYYYRPTLTQWNALALGGNVGSLNGLPPSVNDPNDSDSESEPEDDDDEDSNAEDYYKNDYPDELSDYASSDEFHDDSDYDDFLKDEMSDQEEHDWR